MSDPESPSSPSPPAELDAVAAALSRAIASGGRGRALLWAATPTALLDHPAAVAARSVRSHPAADSARTLLSGLGRARGSSLTMVDRVLFAYEGANPAATLGPVIDARAHATGASPVERKVRPSASLLARGLRDARHAVAAVAHELGSAPPRSVTRAVQAAVRARARAEVALDTLAPRLVVVASQHSTASRSLIHAARARSIPTAYLPHAPVADTYQYRDLPTDFAGLRGPREVDFYRSLGAARDASVVGNPQGQVKVPDQLDASGPVIFAPRPQPPDLVRAQVARVAAAAPEVVVSPHPRMRGKAAYDALWPAHWARHEGWTAELLQRGFPCIIQTSSGVAWEAMAHGVPVIELSSRPDVAPAYLVIREPYARICVSDPELVDAVADARTAASDPTSRAGLMEWALEWCAATGEDAVRRAAAWIDACLAAGAAPGPLLDHWAPAGADA